MRSPIVLTAILLSLAACGEEPKKEPKYSSEKLNPANRPPINATQLPQEKKPALAINKPTSGSMRPNQPTQDNLTDEEKRALEIQQTAEKIVAERLAAEKELAEAVDKQLKAQSIQEEAERLATIRLAEIKTARALAEQARNEAKITREEDPEQADFEKAVAEQLAEKEARFKAELTQEQIIKTQASQALAEQKALKQAIQELEARKIAAQKITSEALERKIAIEDNANNNQETPTVEEPEYVWVDGLDVSGQNQPTQPIATNNTDSRTKEIGKSLQNLVNGVGQLERGLESGNMQEVDLNQLASHLDELTQQAEQYVGDNKVQLNKSLQGISKTINQVQNGNIRDVDFNDLANTLESFTKQTGQQAQQAEQVTDAIQKAFENSQ